MGVSCSCSSSNVLFHEENIFGTDQQRKTHIFKLRCEFLTHCQVLAKFEEKNRNLKRNQKAKVRWIESNDIKQKMCDFIAQLTDVPRCCTIVHLEDQKFKFEHERQFKFVQNGDKTSYDTITIRAFESQADLLEIEQTGRLRFGQALVLSHDCDGFIDHIDFQDFNSYNWGGFFYLNNEVFSVVVTS